MDPKELLSSDSVEAALAEAMTAVAAVSTLEELKEAKRLHGGDGSPLAAANRAIGQLPGPERKDAGQRVGRARKQVSEAFAAREEELQSGQLDAQLETERVDVTVPVMDHPQGARHPVSLMIERMSDIFVGMGWEVADGPEAEAEWFNFDALNLPDEHPARNLQDTFWVDPPSDGILMRTSTSPVQVRTLLNRQPPVYVVAPGKTFRTDEYDATHLPVFHQIEGLVVDRGITMAHLKGSLDHFVRELFGDVVTRFRPHYFPFTEPSAELDIECFACSGASVGNPDLSCRACKSEGWIEWGGCGVVNPRVLRACGVDTDVYSGFAFGMGIERAIMFRNNVTDIRDFTDGDTRFSRAFTGGLR